MRASSVLPSHQNSTPSLLKASPKGEGVHPSQSGTLTDLKSRKEANHLKFSDKIFLALLDMTSTSLEEIEGISELETLIMELESVEASLTDKIKEYWTSASADSDVLDGNVTVADVCHRNAHE